MASFNRDDYLWLVELARWIYAQDGGTESDDHATKLFKMCEGVIGQQSPPLIQDELEEY
jgi:hypothetical protein